MSKARHEHADVAVASTARHDELKAMLEARARELRGELIGRIRGVRSEGSDKPREVLDEAESSDVEIHEGIAFAMIEMKAETLNKIAGALARLEQGTYGRCDECGDDIAPARLRALPFALRCKSCEEGKEAAQLRERQLQRQRSAVPQMGGGSRVLWQ